MKIALGMIMVITKQRQSPNIKIRKRKWISRKIYTIKKKNR